MALSKIDHVGVMVADLEKSLAFYTEVVGLELRSRFPHANGALQLAFLGAPGSGGTEIELIQGYNAGLPAEGKTHHFAVTVDDVEAEYARLKRLGVPFVDGFGEIDVLPNGHRFFFVHGPDGEWIEFFQRE